VSLPPGFAKALREAEGDGVDTNAEHNRNAGRHSLHRRGVVVPIAEIRVMFFRSRSSAAFSLAARSPCVPNVEEEGRSPVHHSMSLIRRSSTDCGIVRPGPSLSHVDDQLELGGLLNRKSRFGALEIFVDVRAARRNWWPRFGP